jgi:hypothetical protein
MDKAAGTFRHAGLETRIETVAGEYCDEIRLSSSILINKRLKARNAANRLGAGRLGVVYIVKMEAAKLRWRASSSRGAEGDGFSHTHLGLFGRDGLWIHDLGDARCPRRLIFGSIESEVPEKKTGSDAGSWSLERLCRP